MLLPATELSIAESFLSGDVEIEGQQLRIGISIGVAIYPHDGIDAATLLANADAALYRAKAEGRGTIRFFESDMESGCGHGELCSTTCVQRSRGVNWYCIISRKG